MSIKKMDYYLRNEGLDSVFSYSGWLGYLYSKEDTEFRIFSPLASKVELELNDGIFFEMDKGNDGVFKITLVGNLNNHRYRYRIYYDDEVFTILDPYTNCIEDNSSVILDFSLTNPKYFKRVIHSGNEDIIIYELNIDEFTENSKMKGKYLGVIEEDRLMYLKSLEITHILFQPFYDFTSLDNKNDEYNPINFNVVEKRYSCTKESINSIKELKKMIDVLHKNGFKVILNVTYTNLYNYPLQPLIKTIPRYFLRVDDDCNYSNISGYGIDIATDRKFMRKYIVDSIKFWANEYKVDGFKLNLMGLIDIKTVREIRVNLDEIDKKILLFGDGIDLSSQLKNEERANSNNAYKLRNISFLNQDLLESLMEFNEEKLISCIKACEHLKSYVSPKQVIHFIPKNLFEGYSIKRKVLIYSLIIMMQGHIYIDTTWFDSRYMSYLSSLIHYRKKNKIFRLRSYEDIEIEFELLFYEKDFIAYSYARKYLIILNLSNDNKILNISDKYAGRYRERFSNFEKIDSYLIDIKDEIKVNPLNFMLLEKNKNIKK